MRFVGPGFFALFTTVLCFEPGKVYGQTLFAPNGTVGNSGNANVGIGTSSPQARLEIGAISANSPSVIIGENNFLGFRRHDGIAVYGIGHDATDGLFRIGASPALSPSAGTSIDIASGGSWISFSQGGSERMRIAQGGNVGIGTATPEQRLQVVGGRFQVNTAAPWDNFQIYTDGYCSYLEANGDEGGLWIRSNTGQKVIIPDANLGIGTTNPTHKLAVNGTIKAKEVIVETTGWSDYVFADNYALAPLSQVEAHIKANKHLPGIPSAAQVAEQGVSVGDMQARLLAKIEELTLHQIAQEKRLSAQDARISNIEAENTRLKALIR